MKCAERTLYMATNIYFMFTGDTHTHTNMTHKTLPNGLHIFLAIQVQAFLCI